MNTTFNFRENELNRLGPDGIQKRLIKRHPDLFEHQTFKPLSVVEAPELTCEIGRGLSWYENALHTASQASTIQDAADKLVINAKTLHQYSDAVMALNGTLTSNCRGFKYHDGLADVRTHLPKPKSPNATYLSQLIFARLDDRVRDGRLSEVIRWSDAVLNGFFFNKSHILSIQGFESFDTTTDMLIGVVDLNQWNGTVAVPYAFEEKSKNVKTARRNDRLLQERARSNRVADEWRKRAQRFPNLGAPEIATRRYASRNPEGILRLGLSHLPVSKVPENGRREGVRALVYAAFVAKCLWGSEASEDDAETPAVPGEFNLMGQDMDAA